MSKAYRLYNNIQDDTKQPMAHAVGCFFRCVCHGDIFDVGNPVRGSE
ncbi:hypothetical protein ACVPOS_04800 [Staphylococcus aureus]